MAGGGGGMRDATPVEAGIVRAAMARYGVRVARVRVRDLAPVNAWAGLGGCLTVTAGLLSAPAWRRECVYAHEAGHFALRHPLTRILWYLGAFLPLAAAGLALSPVTPLPFWDRYVLGLGFAVAHAAGFCCACGQCRRQEFAADGWAAARVPDYGRHLALVTHPAERGYWERLIATHPTPARRVGWLRGLEEDCGGGEGA